MRRLLAALLAALPVASLADGFVLAGFDDESSTGHNWGNNYFFSRMQEKTGVELNLIQYQSLDTWNAAKAGYLSGEELPDVLFKADLSPSETVALYEAGKLIDLRPYLEECMPNLSALLQANPAWERAITLPDGAIVALPSINELQNNNAIWINTVWLDRLHLSMPTTADELTEVLRAFKENDVNQNGKSDEVPMTFTGMWDLRFLQHAFGVVSNDYYVEVTDGMVRQTVTSDENRAFLAWLHTLWDEQLIDHTGFSTTDSIRAITDSKADIPYGLVFGPSMMSMLPSSELDHYDVLQPLSYQGQRRYRSLLGDITRGTFAVTSACKDPAAMLRWVDFLYSEEGNFLAQSGQLDKEYELHSDGTWSWLGDPSVVANSIMKDCTISSGVSHPGYVSLAYQMNYDDAATHRAVAMLSELAESSVTPYPPVFFTSGQTERLAEVWSELGPYCETAMARFVTGDIPLNDENWSDFCARVQNLGMDEVVAIMQDALNASAQTTP
ncbi:MAG: extracellular solute-binding protein [bacterium]|nr:extracellular solute-binding protein [bacterium]